LTESVPDDGYSRNVSSALNLDIYVFALEIFNGHSLLKSNLT